MRLSSRFAGVRMLVFLCGVCIQGIGCGESSKTASSVAPANVSDISSVNDLDQKLAHAKTQVVLDCFATWCGPCTMLAPELDAVASNHLDSLVVYRIDVDKVPELAARYHADAIPLLVLIKDGKVVSQQAGYQNREQLAKWIAP
jgi:thioredoxin 1